MNRKDIAFVILHFIDTDTTIKAVEHICSNCDTANYIIVIVDNASPNNSYNILSTKYNNASDIKLIKNTNNLGFSRGNNVGYRYARDTFHPRYIVMINSDAYLTETSLVAKLDREFDNSHFFVAGPMIYSPDGCNTTNPWGNHFPSLKEINYFIRKDMIDRFWSRLRLYDLLRVYRRHTPFRRLPPHINIPFRQIQQTG